jgi:hypothetical protein
MKARILFSKDATPIETTSIKTFMVVQNNKRSTVHEVMFEKGGVTKKLTFLNLVEATLRNSRYVMAQSKVEFCAKLELLKDE